MKFQVVRLETVAVTIEDIEADSMDEAVGKAMDYAGFHEVAVMLFNGNEQFLTEPDFEGHQIKHTEWLINHHQGFLASPMGKKLDEHYEPSEYNERGRRATL